MENKADLQRMEKSRLSDNCTALDFIVCNALYRTG